MPSCAAEERGRELVDLLACEHALPVEKYEELLSFFSPSLATYAAERALAARREVYGR